MPCNNIINNSSSNNNNNSHHSLLRPISTPSHTCLVPCLYIILHQLAPLILTSFSTKGPEPEATMLARMRSSLLRLIVELEGTRTRECHPTWRTCTTWPGCTMGLEGPTLKGVCTDESTTTTKKTNKQTNMAESLC